MFFLAQLCYNVFINWAVIEFCPVAEPLLLSSVSKIEHKEVKLCLKE
jgi:hypothetical protein